MKKTLICILLVLLCACSVNIKKEEICVSGQVVLTDDNGNADIDISNNDFILKGFNYGDSVNIEFDNGFKLEDIPFLSGMYVEYGETMVYGKESKDKVSFIQKYRSFVENNNVKEGTLYTILLNEAGKFKYIEDVGNLSFSYNYDDYNDEIKFANFREVKVGNIKPRRLFRSASVVDNSENRREYCSKLALDNNINTILNVIDKGEVYQELLASLDGSSLTLIENSKVILAPISNDYQAEKNNKKIVEGLNELINSDYPYLVHCLQGKDRSGYELAIIEALCGASYQEIVDDYMLSYENYYGVNEDNDLKKYNYIKESNIDAMLKFITKSEDIESIDLKQKTKEFLISYDMEENSIDSLIDILCD